MAEQVASKGYLYIKKEATAGTPVTPNVGVPYYSQSMVTNFNLISDEPVVGTNFKRFQTLKGLRSHTGSITVMAEPNTIGYFLDMFSTKASTSGAGPYTHTFGASTATLPNSYTIDIALGSYVVRFWGCQASKLTFGFDGEKMTLTAEISALGSFYGREISSTSTTTVNLKTDYDDNPVLGLVASDTIWIQLASGATPLSTTVSSLTDADTFVAGASAAAYNADGVVRLRAATPSYTVQQPFVWGRTRFFFAADAAAALTASATAANQIRLEPGTEISLIHEFENAEGEKRSGGFDPAALIRTVYDAEFKAKMFFDTPDQIKYWNAITKRAVIMRCYTGTTNQYELQITLNDIRTQNDVINSESAATIYHEIDYTPNYDTSDAKGFAAVAINAVSTI